MLPRPAHLTAQNAAAFQHQSVADHYPFRPAYPTEIFETLSQLITDEPRTILDVGTGTGDLARHLVSHAERVDAVDWSAAMINRGKTLPHGAHPRLHWIVGQIEQVQLHPPYALITAGESLHWMDWDIVLPRFQQILTPHGLLAITQRDTPNPPWHDELIELIKRYSTFQTYQPFDLIQELEQRQLFQKVGEHQTAPVALTCTIEDYIASFHSMSSLSLERLSSTDATTFDQSLRKLVSPWSNTGILPLQQVGSVIWGKPLNPTKYT